MSKDDDSGLLNDLMEVRGLLDADGLPTYAATIQQAIDRIERLHRRVWLLGEGREVLGESTWRPLEASDNSLHLWIGPMWLTRRGWPTYLHIELHTAVLEYSYPQGKEPSTWFSTDDALYLGEFAVNRDDQSNVTLVSGEWGDERAKYLFDKLRAECAVKENRHAM